MQRSERCRTDPLLSRQRTRLRMGNRARSPRMTSSTKTSRKSRPGKPPLTLRAWRVRRANLPFYRVGGAIPGNPARGCARLSSRSPAASSRFGWRDERPRRAPRRGRTRPTHGRFACRTGVALARRRLVSRTADVDRQQATVTGKAEVLRSRPAPVRDAKQFPRAWLDAMSNRRQRERPRRSRRADRRQQRYLVECKKSAA